MSHTLSSTNDSTTVESPKQPTKPSHRRCPASPDVFDFWAVSLGQRELEDYSGPFFAHEAPGFPGHAALNEDDRCANVYKARSILRLQPAARTNVIRSSVECERTWRSGIAGAVALSAATMRGNISGKKGNQPRRLSKLYLVTARYEFMDFSDLSA